MLSHALYLFLLLVNTFPKTPTAAPLPDYTPTTLILLNCGATSSAPDDSGRSWDTDDRSKYAPTNAAALSQTSEASRMSPSASRVPYEEARVIRSPFTYTFPLLTGPKFVRLYFYPGIYSNFDASESFFSVTANAFILLSNFSAFLNSPSPQDPDEYMKEFIINVQENQMLNLTFSPNPRSFAFINGIEIVSIPDKLYFRGDDVAIKFVDQVYYLKNDTALENLYRLNVGGNDVGIQNDRMFRAWAPDNNYILFGRYGYTPHLEDVVTIHYTNQTPPYSAPEIVYLTSRVMSNGSKSLDWGFPVDSGFYYLLRFHFCEFQLEVKKENQRVFTISVNNQTLEIQADVFRWTKGTGIPIFKDYLVFVPDAGRGGKKVMRLSLFPNTEGEAQYFNALLNGLEVFKLSSNDEKRSLAAANPDFIASRPAVVVNPALGKKSGMSSSVIYAVIGSVIFFLAVVTAVSFIIFRRRRKMKDSNFSSYGSSSSWVPLSSTSRSTARSGAGSNKPLPSNLCRYFSLDEIKSATENFKPDFIIGKGGFGNVYKGLIDDGATAVAIKRLNTSSNQGPREFLTEIEMLSKLRHLHLVSLIGYSNENREMILVYDYMSHGTLREHLYNSNNPPLNWKQRLQICLGAARGLHYLHTGASHTIIHRDVKSTNILLDDRWVSKVSDFGLSKVGPIAGGLDTHVTTFVKGTPGYVDPEYYRRQQLTEKSDVYSFGVVLFEVLCARPALLTKEKKEQVSLAEWAKLCCREGKIEEIVDSNLAGQIAPECLKKFVETAVKCLGHKGVDRPSMNDVVGSLEFAIQLQEEAEHRGGGGGGGGLGMSPWIPVIGGALESNSTDENMFSGTSNGVSGSKSSGLSTIRSSSSGEVFSEIANPLAR